MKNKQRGQSIIEMVFAVGVIVMVITGIVTLMVSNVNSKNRGFDRKKATEIAQAIIENLVQQKKTDPSSFWSSIGSPSVNLPVDCNSNAYQCDVILERDWSPKCDGAEVNCARATVNVGWSGAMNQVVTLNRFFSKTGD
jgi:type II secretory pathway pseudopilin PulG